MKIVMATLVVVSLASIGRAQESYLPPGKLVDIGGRRLHLYCTGAGSPTVILEAGASSFSIDWALVQPAVARTNRVCSYDRANYGWSDPAPLDARGEKATRDLHAVLDAAGEQPPFVMVGQSMGGRFVRLFQRRYPREVVGMVLIDAEHEDGLFIGVNGRPVAISTLSDEEFRAAYGTPAGPPTVPEPRLQPAHQRLPADLQPIRLWLEGRFLNAIRTAGPDAIVASMQAEHAVLALLHSIDTTEVNPLKDLPLVVLTRGVNSGPRWRAWQADLARLSTNSQQIVVADCDHEIHLFRPDAVIQAIHDVVRAGSGSKLE
jgi:pimeloyl-ACP methyl ester carboxylesterase